MLIAAGLVVLYSTFSTTSHARPVAVSQGIPPADFATAVHKRKSAGLSPSAQCLLAFLGDCMKDRRSVSRTGVTCAL